MQQTQNPISMKMLVNAFKRRKQAFVATSATLVVISLATTLLLPAVYRSSATILIEQQEIPQELVRSTITSFADQRIQSITQRVMTSANLWSVIEKHDLYASERKREPREVVIEDMREDITTDTISADVLDPRSGRPMKATIAFRIAYDNEGARKAQAVANELTTLFLKENLKTRTELAEQTEDFLKSEGDKLSKRIEELETGIAQFKRENINTLPENTEINMHVADRTEQELEEIDRTLRSLQQQETMESAQLKLIEPYSMVSMENGDRLMSPAGQLKSLQQQRLALVSQYSETHPTVLRIDRQIAALQRASGTTGIDVEALQKHREQVQIQLAAARDHYSPNHPDVVKFQRELMTIDAQLLAADIEVNRPSMERTPDNPAFIQQKAHLDSIRADRDALRKKREMLEQKLSAYEERLLTAPEIENQYRDMQREYENASLKYKEIKAKQLEAQLSSALESEQKGEKFTLIEPPLMPEKPVKPNRVLLAILGILLSLGGGVAVVLLRESLDSSVKNRDHLIEILGVAPLTVIPYIINPQELDAYRKQRQVAMAVSMVVMVVVAAGIHIFVMPLDVLWFVAMRRFGVS